MNKFAGREAEYFREWQVAHRDDESFRKYKRDWVRAARRKAGWAKKQNQRNMEKYRKDPLFREKQLARMAVWRALRDKKISKPEQCQVCGKVPKRFSDGRSGLQAHHEDYKKPLEVQWQCYACHNKLDNRTLWI
jgi:hypothetical protein